MILHNSIKTPDGTILTSRHVHDYKDHYDRLDGKYYAVDGGFDYLKRFGKPHIPAIKFLGITFRKEVKGWVDLSVTDKDDFELIRSRFEWGAYGKEDNQPLYYKKLCNLSDNHLDNLLHYVKNNKNYRPIIESLFRKEMIYRFENRIEVSE